MLTIPGKRGIKAVVLPHRSLTWQSEDSPLGGGGGAAGKHCPLLRTDSVYNYFEINLEKGFLILLVYGMFPFGCRWVSFGKADAWFKKFNSVRITLNFWACFHKVFKMYRHSRIHHNRVLRDSKGVWGTWLLTELQCKGLKFKDNWIVLHKTTNLHILSLFRSIIGLFHQRLAKLLLGFAGDS